MYVIFKLSTIQEAYFFILKAWLGIQHYYESSFRDIVKTPRVELCGFGRFATGNPFFKQIAEILRANFGLTTDSTD